MKKVLSILLTVAFVLGISAVAFADNAKKVLETLASPALSNNASTSENASADENQQKIHEAVTNLEASKLEVVTNEEVTITATTEKQGQFSTDSWTNAEKVGETVLNSAESTYISTAKFKSSTPGTYTISYRIEMSAGNNQGKFVGEKTITIKVVEPKPEVKKVKEFKISSAYVGNQDKGNTKQALYITKLLVTYDNGESEEIGVNIKIGNIYNKQDRNFDVTFEGVTLQFKAEKVLSDTNCPPYPGPEVTPASPSKPEKPGKPDKTGK